MIYFNGKLWINKRWSLLLVVFLERMLFLKRLIFWVISISIAGLLISTSGCSSKDDNGPKASPNQQVQSKSVQKKLLIYASIYPMYDFVKNIGKDKIELKQMLPLGAEPHAWEPTAKLMAELEKADVFIYNGAGIEPWVDKLTKSIKNEKLVVVDASKNVELLRLYHHDENDDEDSDHEHGQYDPHIWLDPINASKQAESIKNALVKIDNDNKEFYEKNYIDFSDKLKSLDNKYKDELGSLKKRDIVVAHDAFGYLAKRYGLVQIAVRGITPEEEPSSARMAKISETIRDREVKYVFFESLTSPKLSEVIASETGAKTAVLNPIDGLTEDDVKAGKDYLSLMEENLIALKKGLGE